MRTYKHPVFQARHYEMVARVFAEFDGIGSRGELIADFVEMFARDNPRFKPQRFLRACGLAIEERRQAAQ